MIPKCSFVIPSYNSAAWLAHAVESALKQDYANIEVVVVNDGSTDSTNKLMTFLAEKDARIVYVNLEKNVGRSEARNIGNAKATGEYILVLDADDIAYPNRATATVAKLKNADFVNGSCDYIDAIGNLLGTHTADIFNREKSIKTKLNYMVHSTCAYRKEIAQRFGYFGDESSRLGLDDWQFQLEVAMSGAKMEIIPTVIGAYRDIKSGISKVRDPKEVEAFKTAFMEAFKVVA